MARLAGLTVVHPVPTALNAILVATLALVAGAPAPTALALGVAMLGFQASIGALNDLVDAARDRLVKPGKPIPAGHVTRRTAWAIVAAGGAIGLAISATFGLAVLGLGAAGYGSGLAYDLFMRRLGLAWLSWAVAFPILITWAWVAAAGELPPAWPVLLPVAALTGPTLHLANSLVDVEADRRAGLTSLATRLGPETGIRVLATLQASVHVLAWLSLGVLGGISLLLIGAAGMATIVAAIGVALSGRPSLRWREAGWLLQASALALLGVAWVAAVARSYGEAVG